MGAEATTVTTICSGPAPANPEPGCLWLDDERGIILRWSGSAWIEFGIVNPDTGQIAFEDNDRWPQVGKSITFCYTLTGLGGRLRAEYERFEAGVANYRLRRPAATTAGLYGPCNGPCGSSLHPILPKDVSHQCWIDESLEPVDGDIVLVEWDQAEIEDLKTCFLDPDWAQMYGGCDISRAIKWFRKIDGHDLLMSRRTAFALAGDTRILGVLTYITINGKAVYGCGARS